jgi:APA family basic amino acid/polyamine antiporter
LLDAARVPLGHWAVPLIVGAATASILKTMNASALVFTRSLFAMARTGVLPHSLAGVHERFGTPHRAILLGYVLSMCGLFMPSSLIFLLLAVNIPTMIKYLACSLCAVRVARSYPELQARTAIALNATWVVWIGYAAALCALLIIIAGLGADLRPYWLVGGWFVVGVLYWLFLGRKRADGSRSE